MSTGFRLWVSVLLMWQGFLLGQTQDSLPPHAWQIQLPAAEVSDGTSGKIHHSPSATAVADRLVGMPGLQLSNLGEGVFQPFVRGLQGSRVVLLERGMPMHGGRWGSDHGAVLAWQSMLPQQVDRSTGMDRRALGSLQFDSTPWLPHEDTTSVEAGMRHRFGDMLTGVEARWIRRKGDVQISVEGARTVFGDRNVPDSGFVYLNRTLPISEGRLTNTSGVASTVAASVRWRGRHDWEAAISGGRIEQGLFPGFVGFPLEADVRGDGDSRLTELPRTTADRLAMTLRSWQTSGVQWVLGAQYNDRSEWAPPHAHGWGPLPDSPLSFRLLEHGAFAQILNHSQPLRWGVEWEWLSGQTSGWEFLLPQHERMRLGVEVSKDWERWAWTARLEAADHRAGSHEEPAYNATGEVIGTDVRAHSLHRQFMGWNVQAERRLRRGVIGFHAISRLPDAYELSANGIHHGTARFERGNPDLRPEHSIELEWSVEREVGEVRVWAAASPDFIFLAPTAEFAPIAHAGQIMAFEQAPAFRTGLEWTFAPQPTAGGWFIENRGALIGAWRMDEGTGLPLTPPFETVFTGGWSRGAIRLHTEMQAMAPSWLLARNEMPTPGAFLLHGGAQWTGRSFTARLRLRNALNTSYFRHINPYRVLDLAEAGRTFELAITNHF